MRWLYQQWANPPPAAATPPETLTLDKWYRPLERPTPRLPGGRTDQAMVEPFQLETSNLVSVGRTVYLNAGLQTYNYGASNRGVQISLAASARAEFSLQGNDRMAVTSSLSIYRGEDITLLFTMIPQTDITGWTLSFKVADYLGGTVQFTKTPSITDAMRGKFTVTIASADTAGIAVGNWVWDVRRTDSGAKTTIAGGTIDLKQEVVA